MIATKRGLRKKSAGDVVPPVATTTITATAAIAAEAPIVLPPVTKELAGPWHFTVQGNGMQQLTSRNDEPWSDIAHRAAHVVGKHGWFVDGNPDVAFRVLKFNQAAREVVVEVAVAALTENKAAHRNPNMGGQPLAWDQRKHPEMAALIARNGGKPLTYVVSGS